MLNSTRIVSSSLRCVGVPPAWRDRNATYKCTTGGQVLFPGLIRHMATVTKKNVASTRIDSAKTRPSFKSSEHKKPTKGRYSELKTRANPAPDRRKRGRVEDNEFDDDGSRHSIVDEALKGVPTSIFKRASTKTTAPSSAQKPHSRQQRHQKGDDVKKADAGFDMSSIEREDDEATLARKLKRNKLPVQRAKLYERAGTEGPKKSRLQVLREKIALEKSGGSAVVVTQNSKPVEFLDEDEEFDREELYPPPLSKKELDEVEDRPFHQPAVPKKSVPELKKVYQKGGVRVFATKKVNKPRLLAYLRRKEGYSWPLYQSVRAALSKDTSDLGTKADDVNALSEHLKSLGCALDNKIILLQAFENAAVGRSVQPMNLNLHLQGEAFVRMKVTEHVMKGWPTLPQAQIKMIVDESMAVETLSLCAIELGLEKFARLLPNIPLKKFKSEEKAVRQAMAANAFVSLVGAVYREKGANEASKLIQRPKALLLQNYDIPRLFNINMDTANATFGQLARALRLDRPYWVDYGSTDKLKLQALYSGDNLLGRGESQDVYEARRKAAIQALLNYYGYAQSTGTDTGPGRKQKLARAPDPVEID